MKTYQLIILLLITPLSLFAQSKSSEVQVDSNFVYANYVYKEGQTSASKRQIIHLLKDANKYSVANLQVFDGMWATSLKRCLCEIDLETKELLIEMPTSYPKLRISLNHFFQTSGAIDFDKSVWDTKFEKSNLTKTGGGLYPEKLDRVLLTINHNPFKKHPLHPEPRLFMNRILEGYGLLINEKDKKLHPIIFRCFINIKGEKKWNIKLDEE
ncbi:MAG: hypothetical protein ACPGJS_00605 [Flammeovirgaceae bacterium]